MDSLLKDKPENIIIRMPNWIGDAVMATPVLQDVRSHFKEANITVMCLAKIAPLIEKDPNIDEIFVFQKPSIWLPRTFHRDLIQPLRKGHYDLGILLTNSLSSAWWFFLGGVKNRLGYKKNLRAPLLNYAVDLPKDIENQHLVMVYKQLLKPLGIDVSNTRPKLYLDKEEIEAAKKLLASFNIQKEHTLIGINPGASYGSAKCWPYERFRKVNKKLLENPNNRLLYFGDATGATLVEKICHGFDERVINLANKTTIRELMSLIACCDCVLTNDSGPMHISYALDVPVVALFGSTSDIKTGPYLGKVIHKYVSCSPCYKRVCPKDFRCMKEITVKEVVDVIEDVLRSRCSQKRNF